MPELASEGADTIHRVCHAPPLVTVVRLPLLPSEGMVSRAAASGAVTRPGPPGAEWLDFHCTDCGNCCTQTLVPITADDLWQVCRGTGLAPGRVASFQPTSRFDDGGEGLPVVQLDEGRRVMCLARQPAGAYDDLCGFHQEGRCSVYEHRPVTCRLFPFVVSLDPETGEIDELTMSGRVECVYERTGDVQLEQLKEQASIEMSRDARFSELVALWNRRHPGGTRKAFFKFLREYAPEPVRDGALLEGGGR